MELVYYPVYDALCKEASLPTDEFLQACIETKHNAWETLFDFVGIHKYAEADFALRQLKTANVAAAGGGVGQAFKNLGSELWQGAKNLWSGTKGIAAGAGAAAAPAAATIQNTTSMAGQRAKQQRGMFDFAGRKLDQAAKRQQILTQNAVQRQQAIRSGNQRQLAEAYTGGNTAEDIAATAKARSDAGITSQGVRLRGAGAAKGQANLQRHSERMEGAARDVQSSNVAKQQQGQKTIETVEGANATAAQSTKQGLDRLLLQGEKSFAEAGVSSSEIANRRIAEKTLGENWQETYKNMRTQLAQKGIDISTPHGQAALRESVTKGTVVASPAGSNSKGVKSNAQIQLDQRAAQLEANKAKATALRGNAQASIGRSEDEMRAAAQKQWERDTANRIKQEGSGTAANIDRNSAAAKAEIEANYQRMLAKQDRGRQALLNTDETGTTGIQRMDQYNKLRAKEIKNVNKPEALRGVNADTQGFARMEAQSGINNPASAAATPAAEAGSVFDTVKRYAPWAAGGGLAAYGGYKALGGGQQQAQSPYSPYGY